MSVTTMRGTYDTMSAVTQPGDGEGLMEEPGKFWHRVRGDVAHTRATRPSCHPFGQLFTPQSHNNRAQPDFFTSETSPAAHLPPPGCRSAARGSISLTNMRTFCDHHSVWRRSPCPPAPRRCHFTTTHFQLGGTLRGVEPREALPISPPQPPRAPTSKCARSGRKCEPGSEPPRLSRSLRRVSFAC